MAKLFIGIALVVMLATAAFSFLAKSNIDKLQSSLRDTKAKIASAEGKAKSAANEAEKAKKEAQAADDKANEATKQAEAKAKEADDNKKAADELKLVVDGKDKELAEMKKKIDDAMPIDPAVVEQLKAQVADMTAQRDNAAKERDEAKQVADSQSTKVKTVESQVAELEKQKRDREKKLALNGLQGRVLAVNAGWNFVVLNVGDSKGVSVNAPLLVVRGNQPIAKLRITSVEPSTSIADVIPGSVPKGVSVQPGDTVIFQGRTSATQPDAKPSEAPVGTQMVQPTP